MRTIYLSTEEVARLTELYKYSRNTVVRRRSHILLYSNQGHSIEEVSKMSGYNRKTIERLLSKWEESKGEGKYQVLSIAPGRGTKLKLASMHEQMPDLVKKYSRNLKQLLHILETQYNIKVCKPTLQAFLKEFGL